MDAPNIELQYNAKYQYLEYIWWKKRSSGSCVEKTRGEFALYLE
jgi:hypothetical protein